MLTRLSWFPRTADGPAEMPGDSAKRCYIYLGLICLCYALCALRLANVRLPFCDEGWLASPGWNLVRHGTMETSVIEPAGSYLKGIDRYTYWIMPLYPLGLAVWYKAFGFGLLQDRSFATFWGVLALVAIFRLVSQLAQSRRIALIAVALTSVSAPFVSNGSTGRMDMMAASLGFIALATFVTWRESNLTGAVFVANTLVAAAVMAHPNALVHLAALMFLMFYFDRRRIGLSLCVLTAIPYLLALGAWSLYISQGGREMFLAQFTGNAAAGGRAMMFHEPLHSLKLELLSRYGAAFGFGGGAHGAQRLQAIPLICWLVGLIGAWRVPAIRRARGLRALLILALLCPFTLALLDGVKRTFYLVYVLPFFTAAFSVWLGWLWTRARFPRPLIAGAVASLLLLQAGGLVVSMRNDALHESFLSVTRYLQQHASPDNLVIGPSELGFQLGYNRNLVDDFRIGYNSGKRPRFIVIDANYRKEIWGGIRNEHPEIFRFVQRTLSENYRPVFQNPSYTIYERAEPNASVAKR